MIKRIQKTDCTGIILTQVNLSAFQGSLNTLLMMITWSVCDRRIETYNEWLGLTSHAQHLHLGTIWFRAAAPPRDHLEQLEIHWSVDQPNQWDRLLAHASSCHLRAKLKYSSKTNFLLLPLLNICHFQKSVCWKCIWTFYYSGFTGSGWNNTSTS